MVDYPIEDKECEMFHHLLERVGIRHEHIPNESRSSKKDAAIRGRKLKSMGVSKGYWDYDVYIPVLDMDDNTGAYELVKIEMKRAKKSLSTVSAEQKVWGKVYEMAGIRCKICYGADDAWKYIQEVYEDINGVQLKPKKVEF